MNITGDFIELKRNEYEDINGGFGIVLTIAAWAILATFVAGPPAVVAGTYVYNQYKASAAEGTRRGTVDAYNDYHYYNRTN
jgi:hypothetical protein